MPITQQQAKQAGVIAGQLDELLTAAASVQAALTNNMTLLNQGADAEAPQGSPMRLECNFPLPLADSQNVLNALLTAYQNNISALQAQLAAM